MPVSVYTRLTLVLGDFILLVLAVPVTLTLRDLAAPKASLLILHLLPFSLLAIVFIAVFFSAGLYDPVTTIVRRELPGAIFGTQLMNTVIAALFFFFIPIFGITPKTNLFIYLLVSVVLLSFWHFFIPDLMHGGAKGGAVMVGDGEDFVAISEECKSGSCPFIVTQNLSILGKSGKEMSEEISPALKNSQFLIADLGDDRLQHALDAVPFEQLSGVSLVNFTDIYEELFRRFPLSGLSHRWLLNDAKPERAFYSIVKRGIDIFFGLLLTLFFIIVLPFVWLAVALEGSGELFIRQKRMGRGGSTISVLKFRTMTESDEGSWKGETKNRITPVGAFLRKTSLDELPQVLSVLKGELSLIGPRSDISGLAERLREAIPFYMLRYSVTPGISGWAQVNQRYSPGNISPQSIDESRTRLMYDLYYIKHRSAFLDLSIVLRTLKTLIARIFA